MSRRIKLTIEYDGSAYHGWQYQDNAISVQEELRDAIYKLTGEDIIPEGAGRTDAGVHAYGQVACFNTMSSIPAEKFAIALNTHLPDDISILLSCEVHQDFHPRFSAKKKYYRYVIINRPHKSAIWAKKAWHVRGELDFVAMERAASYVEGFHNFKAFCASGHNVKTFERTVYSAKWNKNGEFLFFDIIGDGFLYNMVRIIVGTLVDIGKGRFNPDVIKNGLEQGERNLIGVTAPPEGLYLMEVFY